MSTAPQSRRCSACDTNWPTAQPRFTNCPRCGGETWEHLDKPDYDWQAATAIKSAYEEFERKYAALAVYVVVEPGEPPFEVRAPDEAKAHVAAAVVLGRVPAGSIIAP